MGHDSSRAVSFAGNLGFSAVHSVGLPNSKSKRIWGMGKLTRERGGKRAGYLQQEDMGTLMARMTQAISILLKQMVALCWGLSPSATWEMLPTVPGFQVPAGTRRLRKLPVAVDSTVERGLGPLSVVVGEASSFSSTGETVLSETPEGQVGA